MPLWASMSDEIDSLGAEIECVRSLCRQLIHAYVAWGSEIKIGEVTNMMYGDVIDFVNFRIETAESCLDLIERGKVADALGLCRSLLENYLLLTLMCRGRKLFKIEDATSKTKTDGEFKKYVKQQQEKLEAQRASGKAPACIEVRSYRRAKRHVMYIFEGVKSDDVATFIIPLHYFAFRDFQPEAMRLDTQDYFNYYPPTAESLEATKKYRTELIGNYRGGLLIV